MKLWLSGEIDSDVDEALFRSAMNDVSDKINGQLAGLSALDIGVDGWDCIAIIRGDNAFEELVKYSEKKRDMDFRLKVDHSKFKSGSDLDRKKLLLDMLERSLQILEGKVNKKIMMNVASFKNKIEFVDN